MPSALLASAGKRPQSFTSPTSVDHTAIVNSRKPAAKLHPWQVVHACEWAREVLPLVEGQLGAGMRPSLLTPGGFGMAGAFVENGKRGDATQVSLLRMWNHVLEWRGLLRDSGAEDSAEVIHAHSFAAGMAAVRGGSGVVYQFRKPVEQIAASDENSWLARSFRVAEQFVLTRAAAIVVNRHPQYLQCLERSVAAENLFLIPDAVSPQVLESSPDRAWLEALTQGGAETVFFLIPGLIQDFSWQERDTLLRWMRVLSVVRHEYADVKFLFSATASVADQIQQVATACNLSACVHVFAPEESELAMISADVVICGGEHADADLAIEAIAHGRALLAADVDQYRAVSPEGRGCLWFRAGAVDDIARRATFLANNSHFRRALGIAGRQHCQAEFTAEAIGARYDAVYRLAFDKRKAGDGPDRNARLVPLQVGS